MVRATRGTIPLPLFERKLRVDAPTAAAAFAGRDKTVDFHDFCTTVGCCPLKDFDKFTKRDIVNFASPEFLHSHKV